MKHGSCAGVIDSQWHMWDLLLWGFRYCDHNPMIKNPLIEFWWPAFPCLVYSDHALLPHFMSLRHHFVQSVHLKSDHCEAAGNHYEFTLDFFAPWHFEIGPDDENDLQSSFFFCGPNSWPGQYFQIRTINGGFLKWGYPNSWMIYNGKAY